MKKSIFSTKTIVATGLGGALFMVLFMFVKVPSPVPETNLQLAYAISGFFGLLFGPVAGGLIAFIGHLVLLVQLVVLHILNLKLILNRANLMLRHLLSGM